VTAVIWLKSAENMRVLASGTLQRLSAWVASAVAAQHGQLILWAPVALAVGIGMHFYLPWQSQRMAALVMLLGLAVSGGILRRAQLRPVMSLAALAALGLVLAGWREHRVAAPKLQRDVTVMLEARVIDLTAKHLIVEPLAADKALPRLARVRVTLPKNPRAFEPGQRLRFRARLMRPQPAVSPAGYDFARYAWFQKIGATGRVLGDIQMTGQDPPGTISGWFDRTRERAAQRFQSQIPGEAGKVAAALIVGERNSLSEETTDAMRISGLAHLLSVSGFHLVMVAGALFMGTRHVLALSPWMALHWPVKQIGAVVAMVGAVAYTLLTGAAYPSQRAMIAILIMMTGVLLGRSAISLRLVAVVGFLLLLYRPEALLDVSFQLSFMGVAALVAFFDSKHVRAWSAPTEQDGWLRRAGRGILNTLLATFIAELALSPIAIAHFNQLGIYGLLANVVGVPVTGFILMPLGFLSLVLQPVGLDHLVNPVFGFVLEKFIAFSIWISQLPAAQIRIPEIGGGAFALIMFGLVSLILLRGKARVLSGFFILSGIFLSLLYQPPQVRIAPEGKTIAVRDAKGDLQFPDLRGGKFARKSWSEDEAEKAETAQSWQNMPGAACADNICRVAIANTQRVLALMSDAAMPAKCPAADILIDLRRDRRSAYCTAPLYIDKSWLWKNGATEITLKDDRIFLTTYAARLGDHAWAARR
jgi:competence protein ComEC